ncbi:hypothetical protein F5Y16DRAFT_125127 [Xylariaceae sp. FL0255]|nr:hypothetical protein F5Y16DRAFT_125127 [Xylariaceae sp. FL0255]
MHLKQESWDEDLVGRKMTTFTALNGSEQPKTNEGTEKSPTIRHAGEVVKSPELSAARIDQTSGSGPDRQSYQSAGYPETEGTHKRKRSVSVEAARETTSTRDQDPHSQAAPRESLETISRDRGDYHQYAEDRRERIESWYSQTREAREDRSSYDTRDPKGSAPTQADDQAGDSLQRATSHAESRHDFSATSPDGDEDSRLYNSAYSPDQSRDPVIQSDPKKRKRNFSNRTKTGCLTCRKRKKKCDETKPECTNCVRGGFICHGYPNQRGHPKLENKPPAVLLESKDPSYIPPGAYGMPQSTNYPNPPAPPQKRDSVGYRGPYLRLETSQAHSVHTDDDRPTASTIPTASAVSSILSPENKSSALSAYPNPAAMFPTPISAITPMQLKTPNLERPREYQRVPPLYDITRTEPEPSHGDSSHPGPLPQMNVSEPTPPASSVPPPPTNTDPQVAAQLALSHTPYAPGRARTQKEEMLLGHEYQPFDPELVLERQRCSAACWRFNHSTNPNLGVSPTERSRLFREILQSREPINLSTQMLSSINKVGRVGQEVVIEAPFTCDYGYNITVGNNVLIGRNCTILDPVEISIGDNCFFGPNVTLLGDSISNDPKKRQGSKSKHRGGSITIEEGVSIGAGAIIQYGLRIGRGAVVSPGSVVVKVTPSLLPNTCCHRY